MWWFDGRGESGRRIKPLKDRCQTMQNHTQKLEHFREEKKYTNCEYGETQTMNHPVQCPLIGTFCEEKKMTYTRQTTIRGSRYGFLND